MVFCKLIRVATLVTFYAGGPLISTRTIPSLAGPNTARNVLLPPVYLDTTPLTLLPLFVFVKPKEIMR